VNTKTFLVDTSAWILSFKSTGHEKLKALLQEALDGDRVATTPLIVLELLQGCKAPHEFDALRTRLSSLSQVTLDQFPWERAYRLGFALKREGVTVPTMDLLIAGLAIEHGHVLLHHDHHFRRIAEHSDLQAIDFLNERQHAAT